MADHRSIELDELLNRPGTYFNPHTEVLLVVDDSPDLDAEIFDRDEFEEAEWVLISDETPLDEHRRDELLEAYQVRHEDRATTHDGDDEVEVEELEPDEDPEVE
jgi:hypothetical protein